MSCALQQKMETDSNINMDVKKEIRNNTKDKSMYMLKTVKAKHNSNILWNLKYVYKIPTYDSMI